MTGFWSQGRMLFLKGARRNFYQMKPILVMVWAAVSSNDGKSSVIFIKEGMKVISAIYVKILEGNVLP